MENASYLILQCQVYTSEGDSDFSIGIIFMTKYNADDFDSMRKDIDSEAFILQCLDIL